MQSDRTCMLLEQYLGYLITVKGRSMTTILEYRTDNLHFFKYVAKSRNEAHEDFKYADLDFIRSITLGDMYGFLYYCQNDLHSAVGTRARKIVSIRQFWKYLKTKSHLIDNNIAEELETPRLPKRIPKYLTLEEAVRLLIQTKATSIRDNCIITIFLNCALRLSELTALNIKQVSGGILSVIGKGNKERKIFMTPAVKQALAYWLPIRNACGVNSEALFISRNHRRLTTRSVQNIVKKHIAAAGLDAKLISTHKLRHTAATLMYKYGRVDIRSLQQILGHETLLLQRYIRIRRNATAGCREFQSIGHDV